MIERFGSLFRYENRLAIDHCNIYYSYGKGPYVAPVHRHNYTVDLRIEGPLDDDNGFVIGHESADNEDNGIPAVLKKWNNKLVIPRSDFLEVTSVEDASGWGCPKIRLRENLTPTSGRRDVAYRCPESLPREWVYEAGSYSYEPYAPCFVHENVEPDEAFKTLLFLQYGVHGSSEEIARELIDDFMSRILPNVSKDFLLSEFSFVLKLFEEGKRDEPCAHEKKYGAYYMRRGSLEELLACVGKVKPATP